MVDVSASNRFGTFKKFKNEIAAELTALLAYTALKNNDKVGLLIFSDHVEHYLPPKKGRAHIWRLIRDILTYQSHSQKTNFTIPLDFLNRVVKRRSIAFLISDFQDDLPQHQLRVTAKHHDLIAFSIQDPRELELPSIGYVELEDAETGEFVLVDTGNPRVLKEFSASSREALARQAGIFRQTGIDFVQINTQIPYVHSLVQFFRRREKMS